MSDADARARGGTTTNRWPTGTRAAILAVMIGALLLAACGGDDDPATTDTQAGATSTSDAGGNDAATTTETSATDDTTTAPPTTVATSETTVTAGGGSGVEVYPTTFDRLNDIDIDADGTVWVTEANTSELVEISADGPVVHYTGEQTIADPESDMSGLAIAPDGQIWFATRKGIARLDPATDEAEYVVTQATTDLAGPIYRLAVSPDGEVFIGDVGPDKVYRLDGTDLVHIAGSGAAPSADTDIGGPAVEAALGDIRDLAVDTDGNLFIADDYGQRVRLVTPDGTISTFAGGGDVVPIVEGEPAPAGTVGDDLELEAPTGVWVVDNVVYVADITHSVVFSIDKTTGFTIVLAPDEADGSAERGAGLTSDAVYVIISAQSVGRIL